MSFDTAIKKILLVEGGYQEHPNDRGNYSRTGELVGTKYGISARFAEAFTGATWRKEDMKGLDIMEAKFMYYWGMWRKYKIDRISDFKLAELVFDGVVNHGGRYGIILLQRAINGFYEQEYEIAVDGAFGPKTLEAMSAISEKHLYEEIKEQRRAFYHRISKGKNSVFINGWLNRLDKFNYEETC